MIVGCRYRIFNNVFNTNVDDINKAQLVLVNEDGTKEPYVYNGHIELLWDYRLSKYKNVIICKKFDIENTQEGGYNKIRNVL